MQRGIAGRGTLQTTRATAVSCSRIPKTKSSYVSMSNLLSLGSLTFRNATISRVVVTSTINPARNENSANIAKMLRTETKIVASNAFDWKIPVPPTVAVADIDELVGDEVVSVMNRTWCSHRQAVHVEDGCHYREKR